MTFDELTIIIAVLFQALTLAVLLFLSVRLVRDKGRKLTAIFLSFCFALWLLCDIYWLIYDFLRPETRMPFAANEIGEAAIFLMMAASINTLYPDGSGRSRSLFIGSSLFALGNAVLWIGWSGEWIQDILTGIIFAWLFYSAARVLKKERALTGLEWILTSVLCSLSVVSQALTFFVGATLYKVLEVTAYILVLIVMLMYTCKMIALLRKKDNAKAFLAFSFTVVILASVGLYMSSGNWYLFFLMFTTVMLPFCYLSVRKVVEEQ